MTRFVEGKHVRFPLRGTRALLALLAAAWFLTQGAPALGQSTCRAPAALCATIPEAACPAEFTPPPAPARQPVNLGELKTQLKLYYRCFYRDDVAQVLAEAWTYVNERAGQVNRPAVVLDIDETSLSNWMEIWQNDFGYFADGPCEMKPRTPCGVHAWELSAQASAIEPTLKFFNQVKEKNISIFFITGRSDTPEERSATADNLTKVGYSAWRDLIMRPVGDSNTTTEYKSHARAAIERQGYTIIANIGDQWSDLDKDPCHSERGSYSERIFKVPNPFYFIP
jgi:hypothetical protein